MNYTDKNSLMIDRWIKDGWQWGNPITHEQYLDAQNGKWQVALTPLKAVPKDWFLKDMHGCKLLGLASGGGQQMPIFSALGAECTVLDYSKQQLETEKIVAKRENYKINIVRYDMTKPLPFEDESFDLIFHPVSNVYVEEVIPIWKECYRILKKGGKLLAGLDNGLNFAFDNDEKEVKYKLPFNPIKNPEMQKVLDDEDCGTQFSHTLEEQIRGQIKVGFSIEDLYEDYNSEGKLFEYGIPTFWATLAVKN